MKTGIELIAEERKRQIEKEGWTPEHDDEHIEGELALVGALYATPVNLLQQVSTKNSVSFVDPWPWFETVEIARYNDGATYKRRAWDKRTYDGPSGRLIRNGALPKSKRIRNLVKAGALIAAEIDRLQRVK